MRDADDVVAAICGEVRRGPAGAYLVGWDPLLRSVLGEPTLTLARPASRRTGPLVIIHNSDTEHFGAA